MNQLEPCESSEGALVSLEVTVSNDGSCAGAEVVQVYVDTETGPCSLRGFKRTSLLAPGTSQTISFKLGSRELGAWYDVDLHGWRLPVAGSRVSFKIAASSRDIRLIDGLILK